jgi:galactokinase
MQVLWMKVDREEALRVHRRRFGQVGRVFAAPARVNLIGEHTDYTGGFVMPMAIDFKTVAVVSGREDGHMAFYSANYDEEVVFDGARVERAPRRNWSDYPAGVLWSLQQEGISLRGFNMSLAGDIPLGAGLSSSASVEVATAMALLGLAGVKLPLETVAPVCRRAENEYVGAKSGIMDQFAVAGCVAHRAMLLDTRALTYEQLPLPDEVSVVICNSMVKHAVATGEYGDRSNEVMAGQAVLQRERRGVKMLRDATMEDLEACRSLMSVASYKRCRHIITENARVLKAREALLRGDMEQFGALMVEAHASFRDDFEASCPEVDELVEIAIEQEECLGARITGGGFGGCTVNVVRSASAERFVEIVRREYKAKTGNAADCFVCTPSDGAFALATKDGGE